MDTAAEAVDIVLEPMPKGRQLLRTAFTVVMGLGSMSPEHVALSDIVVRHRRDGAASMPLDAFLAHWGMATPGDG